MPENTRYSRRINPEELAGQIEYSEKVRELLALKYNHRPLAFVHTYGCQGNVSDSEHIKGMLAGMGYGFCGSVEEADLVLFNTCAVREHAEDRVIGNIGALKQFKAQRPDAVVAVCGCMMQQEHMALKVKNIFPFVNLIFGTNVAHELPEMLYTVLSQGKRVLRIPDGDGVIAEGIPSVRDSSFKAFIPIMYGCNNFCSYCIVPHVRGRERSRKMEDILAEARDLIAPGYREITLLGQNVNSYGKDLSGKPMFAELLRQINAIEGDFIIRFMTSHPRDCSRELIDAIAECEKVSDHLHLPFQSGNDRVLKAMNRHYTREKYLDIVRYAKEKIPELSLTSDVIVGFPGETYEEFQDTLSLVEEVGYTSLFTFIFSPRIGTPAAEMEDPVTHREKTVWFKELTDLQEKIAARRTAEMVGKTYRVLAENTARNDENVICGRTSGNIIIEFPAPKAVIGQFVNVTVTQARSWIVSGELAEQNNQ